MCCSVFYPRRRFSSRKLSLFAALLFAALLLGALADIANATESSKLPRDLRVPGGVALIRVAEASATRPEVTRDGTRVWVTRDATHWIAVVGLPLTIAPGEHQISILNNASAQSIPFRVQEKKYPIQKLKLNKAMVEPPAEVMARIERESAHLKTVRSHWREANDTNAQFVLPAKGPLSSRFGLQRVLNGKPRSPHAGLDVAAPTGTVISAPGDGIVIDTGDYYFCGKTVFIDHGNGLITLYCHLSEITAKVGASVKQGESIGLVGSTGRSTGPHLHWTVYLNEVAVEPELFIAPPSWQRKN